eukprot:3600843-Pyramimonas_sp.AAC.1
MSAPVLVATISPISPRACALRARASHIRCISLQSASTGISVGIVAQYMHVLRNDVVGARGEERDHRGRMIAHVTMMTYQRVFWA